jgi:protein-L-isoaspartate(D-aspartate) O-methyltransferase
MVRGDVKGAMTIDYAAARENLVRALRYEVHDERVMAIMARLPREHFLPPDLHSYAYEDRPLPIGHGQTISQPLMVALMTEALHLRGDERVLEVGTGSGYQAALLAELAASVVTVERVPELAGEACRRLQELGYRNVEVHTAKGALGWPESAPYDAILVTAGAPRVPRALLQQLTVGGRLVIPVGQRRVQQLLHVAKTPRGTTVRKLGECRFVPLLGRGAWAEAEATAEYFAL